MILSPSYFYNPMPVGFGISKEPGFLTSEGSLLFNWDSHQEKFVKKVDQHAKIKDVAWEGQLFVPVWEFNYQRWTTVLSVLAIWLYLDLPEHISPTPGTAPTTVLMNLLERIFPALHDDKPSPFDSNWWRWGFFAFHLFKVGFIYLILQVGGLNPHSFNPIKNRQMMKREITRDDLVSVGWTGARRATIHEWREENRKLKIEAHGGIVRAYHSGVLEGIAKAGVKLEAGEGFDSRGPKDPMPTDVPEGRFVLTEEYYKAVYSMLADIITDNESDETEKQAAIKRFRRIGLVAAPQALTDIYEKRKALEKGEEKKD